MRRAIWVLWICLVLAGAVAGAETLPAKPPRYFNDYAGVVSKGTADALNARLEALEAGSSNQILVAIYPALESGSPVQDYTFRVAQSWGVGQKGRDNGAVLFVFVAQRKVFIQVGYGLEGVLPDITAKQIVENQIKPAFKKGDYDAGLTAGVDAMIQATRGEYKGTGRTNAQEGVEDEGATLLISLGVFAFFVLMSVLGRRRAGTVYGRNGRRMARGAGWFPPMMGGGWGGGGGMGGGGGGGGGGGFSSGGGSFGGGGAGGDW